MRRSALAAEFSRYARRLRGVLVIRSIDEENYSIQQTSHAPCSNHICEPVFLERYVPREPPYRYRDRKQEDGDGKGLEERAGHDSRILGCLAFFGSHFLMRRVGQPRCASCAERVIHSISTASVLA